MKYFISVFIILITLNSGQAQEQQSLTGNKGKLYVYWGWNVGWYTNSNISFSGDGYDFTLSDVIANDRQSKFSLNKYLNPVNATIPQYNFRIGYYFHDHWNISLGMDHMKYVVQQDQTVRINGEISGTETLYDRMYNDENIQIEEDFLQFEHTDGLNFANIDLRHSFNLFDWNKVQLNMTEGIGFGLLIPRTNTTLVGKGRYDQFHLSGYGFSAMAGLNVTLFEHFFIQSELKGGFMNMPNIRTTKSEVDKASQHFFFGQLNILFGGNINLAHSSRKK